MTGAWYAVYTHAQAEAKAATHLLRQGFETLLPRYLKERRHARRIETVAAPLFPRYLFVRLDVGAQRWRSINGTIGVQSLVSQGGDPVRLPQPVIDAIIERTGTDGFIAVNNNEAQLQRGEAVTITGGPLSECSAIFDCMDDQRRVVLLLDLLGRRMRVAVNRDLVRPSV